MYLLYVYTQHNVCRCELSLMTFWKQVGSALQLSNRKPFYGHKYESLKSNVPYRSKYESLSELNFLQRQLRNTLACIHILQIVARCFTYKPCTAGDAGDLSDASPLRLDHWNYIHTACSGSGWLCLHRSGPGKEFHILHSRFKRISVACAEVCRNLLPRRSRARQAGRHSAVQPALKRTENLKLQL